MRPFKVFVENKREHEPTAEAGDRLITIPNAITVARLPLAYKAASMLMNGETPASVMVATAFVTDAIDGIAARTLDKFVPEKQIGRSKIGEPLDQYIDVAGALIICAGIIRAPRVPLSGKMAASVILSQEGAKTAWAATQALRHYRATGERLQIPSSNLGKEAMIEKGLAVVGAAASGDIDHPVGRQAVGAASLGLATLGASHGETARQEYGDIIRSELATLQDKQDMDIELMFDGYPTLAES